MFLSNRCPICNRSQRRICLSCWESLPPAGNLAIDGVKWGMAIFAYAPQTRSVVLTAKNRGRRDLLRVAGTAMATAVATESDCASYDAVTWVPASPSQRRRRGFDQGRVLARSVAPVVRSKAKPLLRRTGTAQTGRSRSDRLLGPDLTSRRPVRGAILLVDDVVTTGASLRRAAAELYHAGASRVDAVVFAAVLPISSSGHLFPSQHPVERSLPWR